MLGSQYGFLPAFGDGCKSNSFGAQRHAIGQGHTLLGGDSPYTGMPDA
jgi:hypothetical protein